MNEPIYWKVITADERTSATPCSHNVSVTYDKQVWVKPTLESSKLMVFDSLEAATAFAGNPEKGLIVVQCHIKKANRSPNRLLSVYSTFEDVKDFWESGTVPSYQFPNQPVLYCDIPLPDGTVFADEVFCLE